MPRSRERYKGRKDDYISYVQLPHALIDSPNWRAMSPYAVKLFIDLYGQYRGRNNGDFSAAWRIMQPKGWRSKATLHKALKELEWFGMIEPTRRGGLNRCALYAVTFKAIDECGGKLDVPSTTVPSRRWSTATGAFPGGRRVRAARTKSPAHPVGHTSSPGSPVCPAVASV